MNGTIGMSSYAHRAAQGSAIRSVDRSRAMRNMSGYLAVCLTPPNRAANDGDSNTAEKPQPPLAKKRATVTKEIVSPDRRNGHKVFPTFVYI